MKREGEKGECVYLRLPLRLLCVCVSLSLDVCLCASLASSRLALTHTHRQTGKQNDRQTQEGGSFILRALQQLPPPPPPNKCESSRDIRLLAVCLALTAEPFSLSFPVLRTRVEEASSTTQR